jgi:ribonuclease P protein component
MSLASNFFVSAHQNNRFSRQYKIVLKSDFEKFKRGAYKVSLEPIVVYRLKNEWGHYRVGVSIVARCSSVMRNKIKRQIRECFRLWGVSLGGSFDYHIVIPRRTEVDFRFPKKLRSLLETGLKSGHLSRK